MSKEPLFVAFASQKGGVGKTAVTILAASHLHYEVRKGNRFLNPIGWCWYLFGMLEHN